MPKDATELHYTHRRQKKFKSGDMILFSGAGPHNLAARIDSGSNYSSAGLLIELPNKWTGQMEWYIFEATDNGDSLVDPFSNSRAPGLRLFKLEERIYNFHGAAIWWVPQSAPIDDEQIDILRRWVFTCHGSASERPFPPPDPKNIESIGWKQIEQTSERVKLLGEFYDRTKSDEPLYYPLHSPQLIGHALSSLGIVDLAMIDTALWTMESVISHSHYQFSKSRILRVAQDCHSFYTGNDTDKNTKLSFGITFNISSSWQDISDRVPSDKSFTQQAKQISGLKAAASVQITEEESNILHAASRELLRKKQKS